MNNPTHIGVALRLYLASINSSARELARQLGMSHATISRFIQGKDVSTEHLLKILTWFTSTVHPK